jgi:exopolysaccharide biosynthesis polyprenyl glycosylphosphotransferase
LLALLCWFTITLTLTGQRLSLESRARFNGLLQEQRLSVQACLTSGLLLAGVLHLLGVEEIPRGILLLTVGLVTLLIGLRRLVYRVLLYRRYRQGVGTRNVLIMGTGPEAQALRRQLESLHHLGYTFKGFIDLANSDAPSATASGNVVGTLDSLFQSARKLFVDELFFTAPYDRGTVQDVLRQAREYGIDLRVVPEIFDGAAWCRSIEYIGRFPTIPLHRGSMPEVALLLKRALDISFSALALVVLSPVLTMIALAIKLDSHGPVFFFSERIGKKGRVFRCAKFRTMVCDAELRRAEILHMNERDGVLFKVANDPRITPMGRILRKYSLDELPQFFNVLKGDMSVVGPRPPIASEVQEYKLNHLRRLDVTPGITGLWQVQGRQNPSFDSYISLDMTYIENWSLLLDFKIMLRTLAVVFAGTGS